VIKKIVMPIAEQEDPLDDIYNDVLGYGPFEPLLARDEIIDIMVNAISSCSISVNVSSAAGASTEASPICDALAGRLARQRHGAAARNRRAGAHHPQISQR
jgi:Flp pilus assembly CpaF family ATPase